VARECNERNGDCFAFSATVDERECERRADGVIEMIGRLLAFSVSKATASETLPTFRSELDI
jgi:hypothetical protein